MIDIQFCTEPDYPRWDTYVSTHPNATPFHRVAWLNVVRNTYGHQPLYLMAVLGNRVLGVLPLFLIARPGRGVIAASGAFTSYDGVLGDSLDVEVSLMEKAAELVTTRHVRWLEVKNTTCYPTRNVEWNVRREYCTMIVRLDQGESGIWSHLNKSTRKNVRRSERDSIHVERGHEWLDEFYELELLTMRRHGTPVHSKTFYANILSEFRDQATLFIAMKETGPMAAKLVLTCKDRMYSLAAASNALCRVSKCGDLVNWRVLQHASANGFQSFDFGRSAWNSGTFEFKQRMGAVAKPLFYAYQVRCGGAAPSMPKKSTHLRIASSIWSCLPLQVTALLGPRLIKYVP